jgi:hypothetical protein
MDHEKHIPCDVLVLDSLYFRVHLLSHWLVLVQWLMNRKSRFLYLTWMHPGRWCRHSNAGNKCLVMVGERSYKQPWWAKNEVEAEREKEISSCILVLLIPALTYGRGKTWAMLDHQYWWVGTGLGGPWARGVVWVVSGLRHEQSTHICNWKETWQPL